MTPDRDSRLAPSDQPDDEFDDDEDTAGRSILSATWFRVVLVLVAVVIVGAVAVPYVLEVVNPPAPPVAVAANPNLRPTPPTAPTAPRTATPPTPSEGVGVGARPSTTAQTTTPAAAPMTSAPPPTTTAPVKPKEVTAAAAPAPVTKPAPTEAAKPSMPAKDEAASKMAQAAPRTERAAPARAPVAEGGEYFVQVGAFKDQETARRLAATLRAQDYPVTESVKRVGGGAVADVPRPAPRVSAPAAAGADRSDRYDVLVTGGSAADINAKLVAKGLAAEPAGDGVRIRPSLPLRDAVALSKDLNNEGFKVQVRRGGAPSAAASAPAKPSSVTDGDGGSETLYRVRVGGYADRAAALSVLRALQGKGYQPFIAKGRE